MSDHDSTHRDEPFSQGGTDAGTTTEERHHDAPPPPASDEFTAHDGDGAAHDHDATAHGETSPGTTGSGTRDVGARDGDGSQLFPADEQRDLTERWNGVQAHFVDDPQAATQQADELVGAMLDRLTSHWQDRRSTLRGRWDGDGDVDTEQLRTTLQAYRSAFDRLLSGGV